MENTTSVGNKEMTIICSINAPRSRVWQAWTLPDEFAQWYGTPPFKTDPASVSMDVQPTGKWAATMVHETEGTKLLFEGEYREVTPPEKLVMTFIDTFTHSSNIEILTVTFKDLGDSTEVTLHQEGNLPQEQYPLLIQGYSGFMNRLERYLAK